MKSAVIILAVVVGLAVLAFDLGRGVLALISVSYWSTGDQPRPVLDGLAIAGLAISVLLVAGAVTAMIRGLRERSPILLTILGLVMTVVCVGLLIVHVAEANVVGTGFQQQKYRVSKALTFYNATGGPVTLCLGSKSTCDSVASGPAELTGGGLTLAPGEARSVRFSTAGAFLVTVVRPDALAQPDTVVAVDAAPPSDGGADIPY